MATHFCIVDGFLYIFKAFRSAFAGCSLINTCLMRVYT